MKMKIIRILPDGNTFNQGRIKKGMTMTITLQTEEVTLKAEATVILKRLITLDFTKKPPEMIIHPAKIMEAKKK